MVTLKVIEKLVFCCVLAIALFGCKDKTTINISKNVVSIRKLNSNPFESKVINEWGLTIKRKIKSYLPNGIIKCRLSTFSQGKYLEFTFARILDPRVQYGNIEFSFEHIESLYIEDTSIAGPGRYYQKDISQLQIQKYYRNALELLKNDSEANINILTSYRIYEYLPKSLDQNTDATCFGQIISNFGSTVYKDNCYILINKESLPLLRLQHYLNKSDILIIMKSTGSYYKKCFSDVKLYSE